MALAQVECAPADDLLQVALHLGLATHLRLVGIFPELSPGTALTKQVPALIEVPLDVGQAGPLLVAQRRRLFAEVVLLGDEFAHAVQDASVVHCSLPLVGGRSATAGLGEVTSGTSFGRC